MGVMVNKNNQIDDELTRQINADLRNREVAERDGEGEPATPDLAEDAEYVKNLKKTSKFGWIWIALIVLAIVALLFIVKI